MYCYKIASYYTTVGPIKEKGLLQVEKYNKKYFCNMYINKYKFLINTTTVSLQRMLIIIWITT